MANTKIKVEKVREYLKNNGIDAIIVDSWQNVLYCSGFTGYGDALLYITEKEQFIITDSRYYVQVEQQTPDFTLVKGYARGLAIMQDLVKKTGAKKIAFEENAVIYNEYVNYYDKLGVELVPASKLFYDLRMTKSPDEIETIAKAQTIAGKALERTFNYIKAGVTEIDVVARLEYEMRIGGADKEGFDTIVASGIRGSMPHGTATTKVIENGEAVTIDFGAFAGGMRSDMTRTIFVGEPNEKMRKIYNIVKEAQQAAIDGFKPGMTGKELDKIARDIITSYGYGDCFGHGTGHGVGIDIHEGVSVNMRSEEVLIPGMVFSVEPGIYVPGFGGVRIEDLVTPIDGKLQILGDVPSKEILVF